MTTVAYLTFEASKHSLAAVKAHVERMADESWSHRSAWNRSMPDQWLLVGYPEGHKPGDPHGADYIVRVRKARAHECARCLGPMTVLERMTSVNRKEGVRKCDVCREITA